MPMKDYAVNQDVNHFGKDNVGTKDVVETVPFVVQTTPDAKLVNIGIVSGGHGTHVAGTVAGKGFFGGRFDGVDTPPMGWLLAAGSGARTTRTRAPVARSNT